MTYTEIYNEVYGDGNKSLEDLCVSPAHAAAWGVLQLLDGRTGFDEWWEHDIEDDEIRDEIFLRMVKTIGANFLKAGQ